MKIIKSLTIVLTFMFASPSFAELQAYEADGYDVLIESVFLRPFGLLGTVVGSAIFVGVSPLTAIASIPAPHDAFVKLADTIVVKPAKYTFVRPIGDYTYNEGLKK